VNKCSWTYSGGVIAGELWFIALATNENIMTDEFKDSETRSKYFRWGEGPFKHDGETKPRPHFNMWPDMNPHLPWQWQWWSSKW
jgi:hypothetical protein